jgi:hypothetical protein
MINILQEFKETGLEFDKTTQTLTALPFDIQDKSYFNINSYVTDSSFNEVLSKLHYNVMYLYRGCNIGSFSVFDTYLYTVSSSKSQTPYINIQNNYQSTTISQPSLSSSYLGVLLPYDAEKEGNYIFFSNGSSITCIFSNEFNNRLVFTTGNVDPLSGDIQFNNIVDIKTDYTDSLYVFDSTFNNLYQYRIDNFLSNENIYREKIFIKNLIGGSGGVNQNNKFNQVKNIAVNKDFVVVQDYGIKGFKLFDKNLNWLGTYVFRKIFEEHVNFPGMAITDDNMLVVGKETTLLSFNVTKEGILFKDGASVQQFFNNAENIQGLHVSPSNKNIIYINSGKSIKKAWLTNLGYILGEFNYNGASNVNLKWVAIAPYNTDSDAVVLYSLISNKEQFSVNVDSVKINSILNEFEFMIYSLHDIKVKKEEYIQDWTILKSLQKVYYNTLLLLQNIKFKFLEKETENYPIIYKKIYNENFLGYSDNLDFNDNFNIGVNEIFQSDVLNRCVRSILELQKTILIFIINNKSDKTYLSPSPQQGDTGISQYIYFADDSIILSPNPSDLNIFESLDPAGGILTSLGGAPYNGIAGISVTEGVSI